MLNKQKIQKSKYYDIKSVTKKSSKTSHKLCKFIWQAKKFLEISGACNNSISSLYNKMKKMAESENIPDNHKVYSDDCKNQCVIKLLILILVQYKFFLNAIRLTKCVIKLLIPVLLYLILFLIDTRLKKRVIKLFPKNLLR